MSKIATTKTIEISNKSWNGSKVFAKIKICKTI